MPNQLLDREKAILEQVYSGVIDRVSFYVRLKKVNLSAEGIRSHLQELDKEDYLSMQKAIKNRVLLLCDPIIFPQEIYDNPQEIANVDVDNMMIVIHGIAVAVNKAVELFCQEIIHLGQPNSYDELNNLILRVNHVLVDEGYFPSENGSWNKNAIVIHRGGPLEQVEQVEQTRMYTKRCKSNFLEELDIELSEERFMRSLAKDWIGQVDSSASTDAAVSGKYSMVVKRLLMTQVIDRRDYSQMNIKRGIFHQFPLITQAMDSLKARGRLEYDGKTYVVDPDDYEGEEVLGPDKLIGTLTRNIFRA